MAGELAAGADLEPSAPLQSATVGSSAFQAADAFTAREEGGKTTNDGTGHAAAFGIDQNAHPDIDVSKLTPQQAQAIRHTYWQQIGGDQLAAKNPGLAAAVYDTAIMAGPAQASKLLAQAQGDPTAFLQLRKGFLDHLVQTNPEKYGAVAQVWAARTNRLAQAVGSGGFQGGAQGPLNYQDTSLTQFPVRDPLVSSIGAAEQSAAKAAPAAAGAAPAAAPNPAPLGLQPQQVQPAPVPKPIDQYLALLQKQNPLLNKGAPSA